MRRIALIRLEHRVQHAQRGGFSGAIGSQQSGDLPIARGETDAAYRLHLAERFAQSAGFEHQAFLTARDPRAW
jgi:hypothetical protein